MWSQHGYSETGQRSQHNIIQQQNNRTLFYSTRVHASLNNNSAIKLTVRALERRPEWGNYDSGTYGLMKTCDRHNSQPQSSGVHALLMLSELNYSLSHLSHPHNVTCKLWRLQTTDLKEYIGRCRNGVMFKMWKKNMHIWYNHPVSLHYALSMLVPTSSDDVYKGMPWQRCLHWTGASEWSCVASVQCNYS